jgi:ketosteroid isomerase-like protein
VSEQNAEIVRRAFDAFNSEDIERILAVMHPAVEIDVPASRSVEPDVYHGHDGVRRYFEGTWDGWDDVRFEAERLWDADGCVVVAIHVTGRGKRTAIVTEMRSGGVFTVDKRLVLRIRVYATPAQALEAVWLEH